METPNRDELKKLIFNRLKNKVKKQILLNNIDDLVDDHLDRLKTIKNNKNKSLPTKDDIKWWFQKPSNSEKELYEIRVDSICLKDKLATDIFKNYYNFSWNGTGEVPGFLIDLVNLYKITLFSKSKKLVNQSKVRLGNIALVGAVRFNKIIDSPYLSEDQMTHVCNHLFKCLKIIMKVIDGDEITEKVDYPLYIFGGIL